MKILVTGSRGQIARALQERVKERSRIEIVAVGRPVLDLEKPGSVAEVIRSTAPDVAINAAAYTAVDDAEEEPERAFRINAEAAAEAAAAAHAIETPIIQISTDYVFDGTAEYPYREDSPTNPLGAYGRSKLAGEEKVRAVHPDHLIVRTAWVYSPWGRNFVKTMLRLASDRDEVSVVEDQLGSPSSAFDLAEGLLAVVDRWRSDPRVGLGETYHMAGSGSCSWADFAEEIFRVSAAFGGPAARVRRIAASDFPTKVRRPANSVLDSSRFEKEFDYQIPDWRNSLTPVVKRLVEVR